MNRAIGLLAALATAACGSATSCAAARAPSSASSPATRASGGSPAPAPLGLIAFSSDRSGAWRIWVIRQDGTGLRQLADAAEGAQDVDPSISPDGGWILFTSTRASTPAGTVGAAGLWRLSLDGGKPERICDGDQGEWSPDGRKIVFRRDGRIVVRDLAGAKEAFLTPAEMNACSGPAWSPDGTTVAFALRQGERNALYLVPAGGGAPRKLYDAMPACEPHWSPDGRLIVYETETNLWTIRPDGTGNRQVTYYGGVQRFGRFSPDGRSIVFCQGTGPAGPWEIYIVPAAGTGEPRRLTEGASDMYPDWR